MQEKKKKEELTPEEYRQQARDEISEVKAEWKVFLRTGIIMFAALVAIIIACIILLNRYNFRLPRPALYPESADKYAHSYR